ncbi:MAG: HAD family hydrolase [Candidatus Hodarchaeales archaeon]|jgi:phosphoglycolate phosphatase-like HAD superfamily hydrolase
MPQLVYIPIKAILFDFDGTLVDTKSYYFGLLAQYLKADQAKAVELANEISFSKVSQYENNVKWHIVRTLYKVARALGYSQIKSFRATLFVAKNNTKLFSNAKPTEGTFAALRRLEVSNIKLAIISFSSRKKIQTFLKTHLKGSKYFPEDNILAAGEFNSKEEGIVHFMRQFNLEQTPRSCAIIGDLGGDAISGKNIGITTFGLTTGFSTREILAKNDPDAIYDTLLEMEKAVHLFLAKEK